MSVKKEFFGKADGKDVFAFTINNGRGLEAEILNYGGVVRRLVFDGVDVVLGKENIEEVLGDKEYFGALVGRNSNRISKGEFILSGKRYVLGKNEEFNNLHGGFKGFSHKVWDWSVPEEEGNVLCLKLHSPDGDEGFPGNAEIIAKYELTEENALKISYEAKCDRDTVMNLTNHSYFNLNGHKGGTIENHKLWINSSAYTPIGNEYCPTGEIVSVLGGPFDFTVPKSLGKDMKCDHAQIKFVDGYDHNFCIEGEGFRKAATLEGDISGIKMDVYTDCVGMQIYTGNAIQEGETGKDGGCYGKHQSICLETQFYPNSINIPHFPSPVLPANDKYQSVTEYKFRK